MLVVACVAVAVAGGELGPRVAVAAVACVLLLGGGGAALWGGDARLLAGGLGAWRELRPPLLLSNCGRVVQVWVGVQPTCVAGRGMALALLHHV